MIVNEEAVQHILHQVEPVILVAATKYVSEKEIEKLEANGCMYFGENRVQSFLEKYDQYHGKGHWHFIGTLQRNKVKYIIDKVELIHSVNTLALISEIEKQAAYHNIQMHILLEINVAEEETKQGFSIDEIDDALQLCICSPHIVVDGFMMMAPFVEPEQTRLYFKKLKNLLIQYKHKYPQCPLQDLSMGMSNDFQIAIEEGATYVRIGRALFQEEKL